MITVNNAGGRDDRIKFAPSFFMTDEERLVEADRLTSEAGKRFAEACANDPKILENFLTPRVWSFSCMYCGGTYLVRYGTSGICPVCSKEKELDDRDTPVELTNEEMFALNIKERKNDACP